MQYRISNSATSTDWRDVEPGTHRTIQAAHAHDEIRVDFREKPAEKGDRFLDDEAGVRGLSTLPRGSVVVDNEGDAWVNTTAYEAGNTPVWRIASAAACTYSSDPYSSKELLCNFEPIDVLHVKAVED